MVETINSLGLNLSDALPGDIELLPHLLQGAGAAILNAEAQLEYLLLPGGEAPGAGP